MSDLEDRLEQMFSADSRSRRVRQWNIASPRRVPLSGAAFVATAAIVALIAIVALNTLRRTDDQTPGAHPSASAPATATVPATPPVKTGGPTTAVVCGDLTDFVAPTATTSGRITLQPATGSPQTAIIDAGTQLRDVDGYICMSVELGAPFSGFRGLLTPGMAGYVPKGASASSTPASSGVKPDNAHGVITFTNIRTEADARDLQSPAQFARSPGRPSDFTAAVSPDGARVAVIRGGETGQELITFTTDKPNDITRYAPSLFLSGGEFAVRLVWAGDGSASVLIQAEEQSRGPGGGDNLLVEHSVIRSVDLNTNAVREIARISGQNSSLVPLAWIPGRQLAAAIEVRPLGPVANYVLVRGTALQRTPMTGSYMSFSASRDGARIANALPTGVRWWPIDQPGAAKELQSSSSGQPVFAQFRPGRDELGVSVQGPCASCSGGQGVPPPAHFEIWTLSGQQRVVGQNVGFSMWRVDGTAAFEGSNLVDPDTGVRTSLPGGAIKIVDVVRFSAS